MDSDSKIVRMPVPHELAEEEPADSEPKATGGGGAGGNGGDNDLTPQQRQAIRLLVEGKRKTTVAEELGLNPSTLHRWLQVPAFQEAYDLALEEFDEDMRAAARSNCQLAMETLVDVMTEYPRGGPAVSAAVAVLRMNGLYKPR